MPIPCRHIQNQQFQIYQVDLTTVIAVKGIYAAISRDFPAGYDIAIATVGKVSKGHGYSSGGETQLHIRRQRRSSLHRHTADGTIQGAGTTSPTWLSRSRGNEIHLVHLLHKSIHIGTGNSGDGCLHRVQALLCFHNGPCLQGNLLERSSSKYTLSFLINLHRKILSDIANLMSLVTLQHGKANWPDIRDAAAVLWRAMNDSDSERLRAALEEHFQDPSVTIVNLHKGVGDHCRAVLATRGRKITIAFKGAQGDDFIKCSWTDGKGSGWWELPYPFYNDGHRVHAFFHDVCREMRATVCEELNKVVEAMLAKGEAPEQIVVST